MKWKDTVSRKVTMKWETRDGIRRPSIHWYIVRYSHHNNKQPATYGHKIATREKQYRWRSERTMTHHFAGDDSYVNWIAVLLYCCQLTHRRIDRRRWSFLCPTHKELDETIYS
jgi:hypothetical protein